MTTDTPRTDALELTFPLSVLAAPNDSYCDLRALAMQLERELTAKSAAYESERQAAFMIAEQRDASRAECARLRKALVDAHLLLIKTGALQVTP